MKTYGQILDDAHHDAGKVPGGLKDGQCCELAAAAVIAEYEARTFETVYCVREKGETNYWLDEHSVMSRPFYDTKVCRGYWSKESAKKLADTWNGKVVRVTRRRK